MWTHTNFEHPDLISDNVWHNDWLQVLHYKYSYLLRVSKPFLQCKKDYILYNGVYTSGWKTSSQQGSMG